ncbi:MAG: NYN domain-containing protein [Humibacillus sp.]|nr:NYN domain-containing protein [Humibacillus sp.]MDN5779520.1 NYN domain-containing protein [Humibacillus sp.]
MAERMAAVLVDAGYVWKQIAKATGREHRREVDLIGYGVPLVDALVEEAEGDDIAVLRTYWYDAATDRNPNVQQRAIGRTARVKLRLGTMSFGKQKGVDRLIQKDILALANHKAVSDIILLTGDQDMEEELDAAGQHGVLMHVWGIADREQRDNISGRLLRIADEWKVFPAHWAETFVQVEGNETYGVPLASDAALAALRERLLGAQSIAPHLQQTTTADSIWGSDQYQAAGKEAYDSLKEQHGQEWSTIRDEIADCTWVSPSGETHHSIPGKYDTELMDVVEAIVGSRLTSNHARVEVRSGFWHRFEEDSHLGDQ